MVVDMAAGVAKNLELIQVSPFVNSMKNPSGSNTSVGARF